MYAFFKKQKKRTEHIEDVPIKRLTDLSIALTKFKYIKFIFIVPH